MAEHYYGQVDSHADLRFEKKRQKSLMIAYLLWFLAGGTGAHRYYLDDVKSGLIQSCMLIFSVVFFGSAGLYVFMALAIWVLIDAIMIPFMAN